MPKDSTAAQVAWTYEPLPDVEQIQVHDLTNGATFGVQVSAGRQPTLPEGFLQPGHSYRLMEQHRRGTKVAWAHSKFEVAQP